MCFVWLAHPALKLLGDLVRRSLPAPTCYVFSPILRKNLSGLGHHFCRRRIRQLAEGPQILAERGVDRDFQRGNTWISFFITGRPPVVITSE